LRRSKCAEERVKDDKLFLYTQKTGTPVNCPLPPETVKALEGLQNERPEYFFWDWVKARQEQLEADVRRTWPPAAAPSSRKASRKTRQSTPPKSEPASRSH
jgi:hypothetical protein